MSAQPGESDQNAAVERLRMRVDVLEKRLWDLEASMGRLSDNATVSDGVFSGPDDGPALENESGVTALDAGTLAEEPAREVLSSVTSQAMAETAPVLTNTRVPVLQNQPFEVVDVDARMTGESEEGYDYVWQITVQSHNDEKHRLRARVCFVNMKSEVVDEVEVAGLVLFAGRRQKFTGKHSIGSASHDEITGIKAHLNLDED